MLKLNRTFLKLLVIAGTIPSQNVGFPVSTLITALLFQAIVELSGQINISINLNIILFSKMENLV